MTTVVAVLLLLLFLGHDFFSTSGTSLVQGARQSSCTGGPWVVTKPEDEYIKKTSSSVYSITNSNEKYVLQIPNDLSDRRIWRTMIKLGAPNQKYEYDYLNCGVRHFTQLPYDAHTYSYLSGSFDLVKWDLTKPIWGYLPLEEPIVLDEQRYYVIDCSVNYAYEFTDPDLFAILKMVTPL